MKQIFESFVDTFAVHGDKDAMGKRLWERMRNVPGQNHNDHKQLFHRNYSHTGMDIIELLCHAMEISIIVRVNGKDQKPFGTDKKRYAVYLDLSTSTFHATWVPPKLKTFHLFKVLQACDTQDELRCRTLLANCLLGPYDFCQYLIEKNDEILLDAIRNNIEHDLSTLNTTTRGIMLIKLKEMKQSNFDEHFLLSFGVLYEEAKTHEHSADLHSTMEKRTRYWRQRIGEVS